MSGKGFIVVGSDHRGLKVKDYTKEVLKSMGYTVQDVGTFCKDSVDYPDFAKKVGRKVAKDKSKRGILVCGTGIGASIAANKIPGIRAALVRTQMDAKLSKEHNDANIIVFRSQPFNKERIRKMIKVWLNSKFLGGRHLRRLRKISKLETRI